MRGVRWTGVVVGVAAAMLFVRLLVALVDSAIIPYLHGIFAVERPGGVTSFSGRNAALYDALSGLSLLSVFHLALFLGGLVVGGVVRSSPELNGAERIWGYLRSRYLSNRVYKDYDEIFEAIRAAWNALDAERLKSLTRTQWIERAA